MLFKASNKWNKKNLQVNNKIWNNKFNMLIRSKNNSNNNNYSNNKTN